MDLYLKATDEAEMNAALIAAELAVEHEGQLFPSAGVSLDIIGPIPERTGWHVNVRCHGLTEERMAGIEPLCIIPPDQPYRVWA